MRAGCRLLFQHTRKLGAAPLIHFGTLLLLGLSEGDSGKLVFLASCLRLLSSHIPNKAKPGRLNVWAPFCAKMLLEKTGIGTYPLSRPSRLAFKYNNTRPALLSACGVACAWLALPLQGNAKLPGIMAVGYIAAFSETLALAVIVSKGVAPLKDVSDVVATIDYDSCVLTSRCTGAHKLVHLNFPFVK